MRCMTIVEAHNERGDTKKSQIFFRGLQKRIRQVGNKKITRPKFSIERRIIETYNEM